MCNYAYLSLCEASHCYSTERERGRYMKSTVVFLFCMLICFLLLSCWVSLEVKLQRHMNMMKSL